MAKMQTRVYTVIVGDLVGSRNLQDRESFACKLDLALTEVAQKFAGEIYASLTLTRGVDELSGVLARPDKSYRICTLLNQELFPHQFRFAIVRGPLDIAVATRDASQMDGPAFHVAADMIERAKVQERYYCFNLALQRPQLDQLLSELVNLIQFLRNSWTVHQRRVVYLYRKLKNQKLVGRELGITQQAVSEAWKAVKDAAEEIKRAESTIDLLLSDPLCYK